MIQKIITEKIDKDNPTAVVDNMMFTINPKSHVAIRTSMDRSGYFRLTKQQTKELILFLEKNFDKL